MKKLLLGALLVVTAGMAYGKVMVEVEGTTKGTATGSLIVESRGEVIDPTGKVFLEIVPIMSAGGDGKSLVFNHGAVAMGTKGNDLVGGFEARVVKYESMGEGQASNIVEVLPGKYSVVLKTEDSEAVTSTDNTYISKDIKNYLGNNTDLLGKLSYELQVNTPSDESVEVCKGSVIAAVDATSAVATGSFIDRTVEVEVTVTEVQL